MPSTLPEAAQALHPQYQSIQILRGIAATIVVIYHALARFGMHFPALAAGVDIFFVISGFVMVVSTQQSALTPTTFLKRRLQRIVPLYWIALLVTLGMIICGVMDRPLPQRSEILKAFTFISYTDTYLNQPVPFLGVGWTLNYEMEFYILFAMTMFLSPVRQICALAVLFLIAVMFRPFTDLNSGFAFRVTSPLPFEFLFGMAIANVRDVLGRISFRILLFILLIGVTLLVLNFPSARFITGGVPSAMIVAAFVGVDQRYCWQSLSIGLAIGNASYALYLFHGFVVLVGSFFISRSWIIVGPIIIIILAVLLALLIHRYIEKPIILIFRPTKST